MPHATIEASRVRESSRVAVKPLEVTQAPCVRSKNYMVNHHLIISGGLVAEAAAAFLLAQATVLPFPAEGASDIFDDTKLIGICVLGSILGAFISIALFPPKDEESDKSKLQKLAFKFGASLATGVGLTPLVIKIVMKKYQIEIGPDWVIGISTAVAAFGVLAIHIGTPFIAKAFERFWGSKLP